MTEVEQPPQNGIDLSANEDDDNSKSRPADIEQVSGYNALSLIPIPLNHIDFLSKKSLIIFPFSISDYTGYARNGTTQTCRSYYGLQTLP